MKNIYDEDFSFKISLKIAKNKNGMSIKERLSENKNKNDKSLNEGIEINEQ